MPSSSNKTYAPRGTSRTKTKPAVPIRPKGPSAQFDYVDVPILTDAVRRLYNVPPRSTDDQNHSRDAVSSPPQPQPSNAMASPSASSASDDVVLVSHKPASRSISPPKPSSSSNGKLVRQSSLLDHFDDDDDKDVSITDASELLRPRKPLPTSSALAVSAKAAANSSSPDKDRQSSPSKSQMRQPSPIKSQKGQPSPVKKRGSNVHPITSWAPSLQPRKKKGAPGLFRNFEEDDLSSEGEAAAGASAAPLNKGKAKAVDAPAPSTSEKGKVRLAREDEDDEDDDMPRPRTQPAPSKSSARPAASTSRSQPVASTSKATLKAKDDKVKRKKVKKSRDYGDDLRSNLNVDAFVRSTKDRELAQRKKGLEAFRKKRQRRELDSDDDSDDESSESSSSASSISSSDSDVSKADSLDFIVENDDEVSFHEERDRKLGKAEGAPARAAERKRAEATQRRLQEQDDIRRIEARMPFQRLTLDDLCSEYVRWLVLKILDVVEDKADRRAELLSARRQLRQKQVDMINSMTSMTMRKHFYWVLRHYPHLETRSMSRGERLSHLGCAACKKTKQTCESRFSFFGRYYDADTLEWREGHLSSEMSTEGTDLAEREGEGKDKRLSFYLGSYCAMRARHLHSLYHWEYNALSTVNKLPSLKAAKRAHKAEALLPEHIEAVVNAYARTLADLMRSQESLATDIATRRAQ